MGDRPCYYEFDWDPAKAKKNRRKHGVTFQEAATVFLDPRSLSVFDGDHSAEEDRWITLGRSSVGRLLVICHTFQELGRGRYAVRIISSRRATKRESKTYAD